MLMDFRSVSENDSRFFSKNFFSICSCGFVDCSFDYTVETFMTKSRLFSINVRNWQKTPKKIFSLNGSFRHVEHSSNNPTEKILDKRPKMLRSVSEKDWKDEIYSGKFFSSKCSSRRAKRSFDNPVDLLSRKNQKNFAQALKSPKKFSNKITHKIVPKDT